MPYSANTAVFVDANTTLAQAFRDRFTSSDKFALRINPNPEVTAQEIPAVLDGAKIAIVDHSYLPNDVAKQCPNLEHVVFLGIGARSYMDPEGLAALGITVHTIKGYGDTAVAECAFALMWSAAKRLGVMDRGIRAGNWLRTDGLQLTGKTLGLVGFGGIAAELARLAHGCGMQVIAWNRSAKTHEYVKFVDPETLLASSDVLSLHLLLNDETRGYLSRDRIRAMKRGAILINTARGALVDEQAMLDALASGQLGHAGLDVYTQEPLPAGHPLTTMDNVTLSAHSAFRTREATYNLTDAALDHCRRIAGQLPGGAYVD